MILDDYFLPIDSTIGFIKGDIHVVVDFFSSWHKKIYEPSGFSVVTKNIDGTLFDVMSKLLPLTIPVVRRHLFIPTRGGWVAYFNNSKLGTDPSCLSYLSKQLKTRVIRADYLPETIKRLNNEPHPHGGTAFFEVYDPSSNEFNSCLRYIRLINEDGKWSFETGGKPFSFEKQAMYKAKNIKDRFGLSSLVDYLMNLGIDVLNEDFYLSEKSMLEDRIGPFPASMREFSLEEALS